MFQLFMLGPVIATRFPVLWAWRKPLLIGLAAVILAWTVWWFNDRLDRAREADELERLLIDRAAQEERSHTTGINLETGLNDYRPAARTIDRKVQDATSHDTGNRFDAGSVQRTADRIAAGEAARKRAQ